MRLYYNIFDFKIFIKIYVSRGIKMELRQFESKEHYVIISALVGLMDSITDYSKVSLERFKELLDKNQSIMDYTLALTNNEIRFLFDNLEQAWRDWAITKVPMTLKEYLDYTFKRSLENKYEEDSLVHNNGINFLVSSINEQLNTNKRLF